MNSNITFPAKFKPLFSPYRYKVFYGGRGSGKSWCVARWLLIAAAMKPLRVLCAREFQTSIKESVHKLLSDQISVLALDEDYEIQNTRIIGRNGSEFIFKGIRTNTQEIKSLENVDICWIEEGQAVSNASLDVIIPTIRKDGSEIVITFNPENVDDPVYKRFVSDTPPSSAVIKVDYRDNPWFPQELEKERLYCYERDPDSYNWIWEGGLRKISDAQVFKGVFEVKDFETPAHVRFYHGADWGYADDPAALVRCYEEEGFLYIDMEVCEKHVELDDLPRFFNNIPTARRWPVFGDSSRPDIIKHLKRRGYNVKKCDKWPGSVEQGIVYLRNFHKIFIHPRCVRTLSEFERYSWKQDRITNEILPVPEDKNNHCIDALRYALTKHIKRGSAAL